MISLKKILITSTLLAPAAIAMASVSCSKKQPQIIWSAAITNKKEDGFILSNNTIAPNQNYSAYIQSEKFVFDQQTQITVQVNGSDIDFKSEIDEVQPTILYIDIDKAYITNNITIFIDVHSMQYSASITNPISDGYTLVSPNVVKHKNYSTEIVCNTPLESDFVTSVKIDSQEIPYTVEISPIDNKKAILQISNVDIAGDIQITLKHPEIAWAISNGLSAIVAKQGSYGISGDFTFYYNGSQISRAPISITMSPKPEHVTISGNSFYWSNQAPAGDYEITLTANYGGQTYTAPLLFSIKQEVDFCTDTWDWVCQKAEKGLDELKQTYNMTSFIGLTRKIQIKDLGEYDVRVIGQDHDIIRTEGSTLIKSPLSFELEQVLPEDQIFSDTTSSNNGYWYTNNGACSLYHYLNDNIFPLLPAVLQQSIIPVLKESCTNRDTGEVNVFNEKLWIPSATELFGEDSPQFWCQEGYQYEYFGPLFGLTKDKLKKHKLNVTDLSPYWTRSVVYDAPHNVGSMAYYIDDKEHSIFDDVDVSYSTTFAFSI